jgi:biotin carboxylase
MSGIHAAQAEGISVFALDGSGDAPGLAVADRACVVDIRDPDAVVRTVLESGIRPDGAAAFVSDAGMSAAAALRETFELPGPGRALAARLTNKCLQRQSWTDAALPCPKWRCPSSEDEARTAVDEMGDVFVIKPCDSAGSRGVSVIEPGEDWEPAFVAAVGASPSRQAIIEGYVLGVEYTVETFSHRGNTDILAVSEKRKVPGTRGTVAMELATPGQPKEVVDHIGELASQALAALGYSDGPGHTEILRREDGSLWLVETAGRGGGFMVADGIVTRASGYDLARACARQAVGLEPAPVPKRAPCAFVLRFLPARTGVIVHLSGFERIAELGGVDCGALVNLGDRVERASVDGARLAYILSWGADRNGALALADRAESLLRVEIAEDA